MWKLQEAMHGLKTAPKAWELHFAATMAAPGAKRLQSEANIYNFPCKDVHAMSYADDTLALVLQDSTTNTSAKLKHVISYPKGTDDYGLAIQLETTHSTQTTIDVTTCVGSDWTKCTTTRKFTTGCAMTLAGGAFLK